MSSFVLQDHGGGRFSLSGHMTFDTAGRILRESEIPFEEHTRIEVDLSGVDETDSAGLALLLEWITGPITRFARFALPTCLKK